MKTICNTPILGFAAFSGTGKTTLLEKLIPKLTDAGLRLGVLKHAHHNFDIDQSGKDSYRLRKAGATQMFISSRYRNAMITETADEEATFHDLLMKFDHQQLDLILIEGFKSQSFPKIELRRQELHNPWMHPTDNNIVAVASDIDFTCALPTFNINDLDSISQFIIDETLHKPTEKTDSAAACCDALSPAFLSVEQGIERILSSVTEIEGNSTVQVDHSLHYILAKDIVSSINVPQHTNSAMDGYAIRDEDVALDKFELVAEVMAGQSYPHPLKAGEAVKIMTGAPVPNTDTSNGATVIMREQSATLSDGDKEFVTFNGAAITAGQNVRAAGEDLAIGQNVFNAGSKIGAAEMGMIASLGINDCLVKRKLKVAIFSTGDEVQHPSQPLQENCIFDSNRYALMGLLSPLNCEIIDLGILEDDHHIIEQAISEAAKTADLVLTTGGVSVGDADYIKDVLEQKGNIDFWRINMRPGRPLAFGTIGNTPFFGLPGNPVATMVSFINFVEPAIHKMQGEAHWKPTKLRAIASESLRSRHGRTEFTRGIYQLNEQGQLVVSSTGKQGSGILRSMSEANCLIEIDPLYAKVEAGELVTIIPLKL
ncbi:bifunctional molybdopterin-guanine dinucleotide biosynthesis protein MobB/molybdopterin molybdotransferase MoeA [Vibrio sp. UCD-FRSSP16_10]|uniref:bifunctional molybdopterin-guanine dinucleotide biosynthesis adaptor protein MobB/molybdopterin molybdotransferase MoeA n=1 Tax=unclassified Vibrio TaxID=2614977 RepID=UPI0008002FE6|nr:MULTISPECIES: bifunctional molybdopterin-guanine dinucleotide biosynthesis adaptor protein MobB/molybdopterin molybdotransferase MoeA [unclassified Vibrio]OBT13389.1 bifunctional molybdopterin-guanine dinucleotide biosynthesis protein MobB/molybdopterin molybdotransferase MoeA [Vibrio sp. UCD-FRSSP16_10]OBT17899.1 bifunctional molybdopterin-guanine dinucleotide biosynthesis protein MobB/molybdopterin molybdotransferase MoeA [Vibrio sp. UCD-FRSSP16_30]